MIYYYNAKVFWQKCVKVACVIIKIAEVDFMRQINHLRLKRLREKMYLEKEYIANLLNCQLERYEQIENGDITVDDHELQILSEIFYINKEHLLTEESSSTTILARTHDDLTENDKRQISEFLNFQKMLKKKKMNKEIVLK